MLTTTVTSKGQVVIPASLRKRLRIEKGAGECRPLGAGS